MSDYKMSDVVNNFVKQQQALIAANQEKMAQPGVLRGGLDTQQRIITDGDRFVRQTSINGGKTWTNVAERPGVRLPEGYNIKTMKPAAEYEAEIAHLKNQVEKAANAWKGEHRTANQAIAENAELRERVEHLEAVVLPAMKYVKHQSARYQRDLIAAIDELEKHPKE